MGLKKWSDSPHWTKKPDIPVFEDPIIETVPEVIQPELPVLMFPHTAKEIREAILDDPRYNAINPSNQEHIIDMAIASARSNGMLIETGETDV